MPNWEESLRQTQNKLEGPHIPPGNEDASGCPGKSWRRKTSGLAKPALSVTQEGGMWMDGEKLQLLEMFCNLNENIVLILNVILI